MSMLSLERCSDVWFDDGTVILQAEHTLFKVYFGILQAQSPFFRDMFALPQVDSDLSEKYEDCPLVTMQGDSAADVRVFLKALFDSQFYADVKAIKDLSVVIGVLKLSHKYQVEHLVRRSLPTFTAIYPTSLQKWDIRQTRRQWSALTEAYGRALPIFVINIARTIAADTLLPSALFECCAYSYEEIILGVTTPDGVVHALHPRDQILVIKARESLAHFARNAVFGFIYQKEFMENAVKDPERWTGLHRWVQGNDVPGQAHWTNPLDQGFPWNRFFEMTRNLNVTHRKEAEKDWRSMRRATWATLPAVFGLSPWDKMKWEPMK